MKSNERLDAMFAAARTEAWDGAVPRMPAGKASGGRLRTRAMAMGLALCGAGAAYGGYRLMAASWQADIRAEGDRVEVVVDGQVVPADSVEWLPDGTCLVEINGAKVLLDPRQPGGASASIKVEHADE